MTDIRHQVRLSRTLDRHDGSDAWKEWEARIDREREAVYGPPHIDDIRLAEHCAQQERAMFGRVRTRFG